MNKEKVKVLVQKAKGFLSKCKKKLIGVGTALGVTATTAITSFAAEGDVADAEAINAVKTAFGTVSGTFSVANALAVIAVALAACCVLALFWFGVRKITRMIMNAFRKGKVAP